MKFSIFSRRGATKGCHHDKVPEMPKHPNDSFMDTYLLGKMGDEARDEFEEHYFNCETCFVRMAERDKIIRLLRDEKVLGALAEQPSPPRLSFWKRLIRRLTHRHIPAVRR